MVVAEVGCPVLRPAPHVGRGYPGQLPGGRTAPILHVGLYEDLEGTYAALRAWLGEVGATPTGPRWEVHWSGPGTEPDPATRRTEILVPLG